ncbi:hypothetical protein ABEW05_002261 [Botrytis cinerea]
MTNRRIGQCLRKCILSSGIPDAKLGKKRNPANKRLTARENPQYTWELKELPRRTSSGLPRAKQVADWKNVKTVEIAASWAVNPAKPCKNRRGVEGTLCMSQLSIHFKNRCLHSGGTCETPEYNLKAACSGCWVAPSHD